MLLGLLLTPMSEGFIPNPGGFRHFDKVIHFGLFAITGFVSIYGLSFVASFRNRLLLGLVLGIALAMGTELGQYFIPFREPEFYDLMAGLAGLFLGLLSYTLFYCWKLKL